MVGMGLPFLLAFLPDTALAICSRSTIVDGILFRALAQLHPQAFSLGYLFWAGAIIALLLLLPELLAVVLTIAVVFGHAAGAYLQLTTVLGSWWYQAANLLFLFAAISLGTGLTWSARAAPPAGHAITLMGMSARTRWGLVAMFSAVALSAILHRW
jgi:hypothetical protein